MLLCGCWRGQEVTEELLATGQFELMSRSMDEDEHSIEMHLPFIKKVPRQSFRAQCFVSTGRALIGRSR